jgi:hypothetical protein
MKKMTRAISDELRPEYDFAAMKGGIRGKYVRRVHEGTNIVVIAPDTSPLEGCCRGTAVPGWEPENREESPLTSASWFLCRNRAVTPLPARSRWLATGCGPCSPVGFGFPRAAARR